MAFKYSDNNVLEITWSLGGNGPTPPLNRRRKPNVQHVTMLRELPSIHKVHLGDAKTATDEPKPDAKVVERSNRHNKPNAASRLGLGRRHQGRACLSHQAVLVGAAPALHTWICMNNGVVRDSLSAVEQKPVLLHLTG